MDRIVHANAIGHTAYLNNILFGHAKQIRSGKVRKSGHVLTQTMVIDPLDELQWCHVLVDDQNLCQSNIHVTIYKSMFFFKYIPRRPSPAAAVTVYSDRYA